MHVRHCGHALCGIASRAASWVGGDMPRRPVQSNPPCKIENETISRRRLMSVDHKACPHTDPRDRRNFLGASFALTATAAVGTGAFSEVAYADALTKAQRDKLTPDAILA